MIHPHLKKQKEAIAIGQFRIVLGQKNEDETEGTSLHFPLFVQRKM